MINLQKHLERRSQTRDLLKAMGFSVVIPYGVCGVDVLERVEKDKQYCMGFLNKKGKDLLGFSKKPIRTTDPETAPGVFGCTWSHDKALAKAYESFSSELGDALYALIVEDDCRLNPSILHAQDFVHILSLLLGEAMDKKTSHMPDIIWIGGLKMVKNTIGTKTYSTMQYRLFHQSL